MLRFDVITLFPEAFAAITDCGITRRAQALGLWNLTCWNPRDFADNRYGAVDDRPFGGGPGMVMQAPPVARTLAAVHSARRALQGAGEDRARVIYLSPSGAPLTHQRVLALAATEGAVLLCGRYEGVDERLLQTCVDEEISLGDFVLSGGELAAMAGMDACVRQLPGALGDEASCHEESFVEGLLDWPHYTRPEVFQDIGVPTVLLSGHHEQIRRWRLQQALGRTWQRRPDLLLRRQLNREEAELLAEFQQQTSGRSDEID